MSLMDFTLRSQRRWAQAMNNCDFVVEGYGANFDKYRAFLWNAAAGFQDLNSLIPSDSGWTLKSATAINDRGEIVGRERFITTIVAFC